MSRILIPIRTHGPNAREHWRVKAKRVKSEREATAWILARRTKPPIPCSVRLTRVGPSSGFDDDNLIGAMKGIRDEIAAWLGVDDRHRLQVRYLYDQRREPAWGVVVEFGAPFAGAQFALLDQQTVRDAYDETRIPF